VELAVEVFEQGHHRSFVVRSSKSKFRIGRGWNNEVIVRDPLVDAEHLEIYTDESGFIRVRDLQTENGTRIGRKPMPQDVEVPFGQPVRIGHSNIVIHQGNEPVPAAEPTPQFEPVIERMQQPVIAIGALILAMLVALLSGQFSPDIGVESDGRVGRAMFFGLGLIFWAAIWGVIARLLRHEMAFWGHLTLSSVICSFILIADLLIDWMSFNLLSLALARYGYSVLFAVALLGWMFIGLDMSTRLKPLRRAAISAGITGMIVLVMFVFPVGGRNEPDHSLPPMVNLTQPPERLVAADISVEEFLERSSGIFDRLDQEVVESLAEAD
jgi:hypothetical protein